MSGGQAAHGVSLRMRICREYPELPIIVVTMMTSVDMPQQILAADVRGLVEKTSSMAELATAVRAVMHGRDFLSAALWQTLADSNIHPGARLSVREIEVLRLFASGVSVGDNAAVAQQQDDQSPQNECDGEARPGLGCGDL